MKDHLCFQNNNNENAGLRMSLASVKYGKYALLVPDVVTYTLYKCFSFQ